MENISGDDTEYFVVMRKPLDDEQLRFHFKRIRRDLQKLLDQPRLAIRLKKVAIWATGAQHVYNMDDGTRKRYYAIFLHLAKFPHSLDVYTNIDLYYIRWHYNRCAYLANVNTLHLGQEAVKTWTLHPEPLYRNTLVTNVYFYSADILGRRQSLQYFRSLFSGDVRRKRIQDQTMVANNFLQLEPQQIESFLKTHDITGCHLPTAYVLRQNRDRARFFRSIQMLIYVQRNRPPQNNVWARVPRDIVRYMFAFVKPQDWDRTVNVTPKNPAYTAPTIKLIKELQNTYMFSRKKLRERIEEIEEQRLKLRAKMNGKKRRRRKNKKVE